MIPVCMGDKDGIQMTHIMAQHLLPEIGADVEKNIVSVIGT